MVQNDADGSAYIAICATETGGASSDDPADRTAAIMREHGCGPPSSAKKRRRYGYYSRVHAADSTAPQLSDR